MKEFLKEKGGPVALLLAVLGAIWVAVGLLKGGNLDENTKLAILGIIGSLGTFAASLAKSLVAKSAKEESK